MDKLIRDALNKEIKRQNDNIELIASENYVSKDILELQGSVFTNKYQDSNEEVADCNAAQKYMGYKNIFERYKKFIRKRRVV